MPSSGMEEWMKAQIDYSISSCSTRSREELKVAYNLRNGVRDTSEFAYLWEAYGTEFPASMKFIPVFQSIFNSIIGQEMLSPIDYKVGCNDKSTLDFMSKEKQEATLKEINYRLKKQLSDNIEHSIEVSKNPSTVKEEPANQFSQEEMSKMKDTFDNWIATVEIDTQDCIGMLTEKLHLKQIFNVMMEDLITSGEEYYQCKVIAKNKLPLFRALNPLNIYTSKSPNIKFIKELDRVVYKEMVPLVDVINLYGHLMKEEDLNDLTKEYQQMVSSGIDVYDLRMLDVADNRLDAAQNNLKQGYIEVNYVEFKANKKVTIEGLDEGDSYIEGGKSVKTKFKQFRFEGVRIRNNIYVAMGKSKYIQRSVDNPSKCHLTINGIHYNDRNGKPYSLVLNTKDIQDKSDIIYYHLDNLIAMSGSKALPVNIPDIPVWMGNNPQERVMKWLGMVKQGVAVFDYSQDGVGVGRFANYGDFDLTLGQSAKILIDMLGFLEETAYKVTGVTRQAVGNIAVSDGKATTERAITQTSIVTQPIFATHEMLKEAALTDLVNATRMAFQETGLSGSYVKEKGQRVFTTSAAFHLADIGVYITSSAENTKNLESFKSISMELVKAGQLDAETAIDTFTVKSLTQLKESIKAGLEMKKKDNTAQLQDQLKQATAQIDKLNKQLQSVDQSENELKKQELQIDTQKLAQDKELKEKELDQTDSFNKEKIELDKERVRLEGLQITYSNQSLEVKNK